MSEGTINAALKVYNIQETAEILKVTTRTLYAYLKEGKIKARKIGRQWRISAANLERFINGEE